LISNLSNQLKEQGALDRMNEVLKEIPLVREDLGFPPLVTPTSQIVGTQAVFNVLSGQRYKNISNEIKLYFQGKYGRAPGQVNAKIQQMAIGNEAVIERRPADLLKPELERFKKEIGELAKSEEDVLTYALFPDLSKDYLQQRQDGTLSPEALQPLSNDENSRSSAPSEFNIKLHGEKYHIKVTGSGHPQNNRRPFYVTVDGVPEELMLETLDEVLLDSADQDNKLNLSSNNSQRIKATEPGHVTTAMPGIIVDVLVSEGDKVEAGTALIITQAMKMETEIDAPVAGTIKAVHVSNGDTVNPDECLIEISQE